MRVALLIAVKDVRQRIRDRSFLVFAVVLPLALAFVFNLVLGGTSNTSEVLRYVVFDEDRGQLSVPFKQGLERADAVRVSTAGSADQAIESVESGASAAAFLVPRGFSDDVSSGRAVTLRIVGNVTAPLGVSVAHSIADSYVSGLRSVQLSVATAVAGGSPRTPADLAAEAATAAGPLVLTDAGAARKELDTSTFFAAGMAVFFLFFAVQFGVSSLLDERRDGTLTRLLAAPVPRGAILSGKLVTSFVVGVLSMAVLVVATSVLLGASWGDPLGVGVLVLTGVLAAIGVTAVVAGLARTAEQAGNWQAIVGVTLGTLGGVFFPVASVGGVLAAVSWITPHRWFMRGLADLAGGGGPQAVLPAAGAMLLFTVVTGGVAVVLLRRVVEP